MQHGVVSDNGGFHHAENPYSGIVDCGLLGHVPLSVVLTILCDYVAVGMTALHGMRTFASVASEVQCERLERLTTEARID